MLERITAIHRHKPQLGAVLDPLHGAGAFPDQDFRQIGIDVVLRYPPQIIQILLYGVFAKVSGRNFFSGKVRDDFSDGFQTVMDHAETSGSEDTVATALVFRGALQYEHALNLFPSRHRRA